MTKPHRIAVVEDLFVRKFLCLALKRMGHMVRCGTPEQVRELIGSGEVDLLVTNTPAAFEAFGEIVPLLYVAACPEPLEAVAFRRWIALRKPFQNSELAAAVQQLLAAG